jgi:hypothetical protein
MKRSFFINFAALCGTAAMAARAERLVRRWLWLVGVAALYVAAFKVHLYAHRVSKTRPLAGIAAAVFSWPCW